jgi:hypothetical protein
MMRRRARDVPRGVLFFARHRTMRAAPQPRSCHCGRTSVSERFGRHSSGPVRACFALGTHGCQRCSRAPRRRARVRVRSTSGQFRSPAIARTRVFRHGSFLTLVGLLGLCLVCGVGSSVPRPSGERWCVLLGGICTQLFLSTCSLGGCMRRLWSTGRSVILVRGRSFWHREFDVPVVAAARLELVERACVCAFAGEQHEHGEEYFAVGGYVCGPGIESSVGVVE